TTADEIAEWYTTHHRDEHLDHIAKVSSSSSRSSELAGRPI
ncbi:MAG: hypothetical protein QOH29_1696, partial [Actinomycetota bacterium]|nr:hypothetical protein [Actinomycetota bacterium]